MIDLTTAKPREIEAYLRAGVLRMFGDKVENLSSITSSNGYYHVSVVWPDRRSISFANFRKQEAKQILKTLKFWSVK